MQSEEQHLAIGSMVDRYRIEGVLGIGGFGVTYLATDTQLECPVAIKEFMPDDCAIRSQSNSQIVAKTNRQADYQYGLERFLDEAKTLAKFNHPNIVRVSNFIEANNTAYLVMGYEEGEALDDKLKRIGFTGQMPEAEILAILKPILNGLDKVHQQGLLHRDIKPGNIYLRQGGEPILIDFGAARYALGSHSKSISAIISMGYAPPEQYSSRGKQGAYSDLYALGATIYQLMNGRAPEESPVRREATVEGEPDPMAPAVTLAGNYSRNLSAVIDWCLRLSGKQRPQSAAEVLKALEKGVPIADNADEEVTASGTRRVKEGEHFGKKSKLKTNSQNSPKKEGNLKSGFVLAPIAIAVLLAAAGGYWWSQQGDELNNQNSSSLTAFAAKVKPLAVTIRANVAAAQIYIDDLGPYQAGQKLAVGNYTVIADAEGYKSLRQQITVGPGSTFFKLQLEELPPVLYPLNIAVTPADAAIQVLNIEPQYQQGMRLPVGEYRIKVSAAGYTSKTLSVKLSEQQQRFNIDLIKKKIIYRVGQTIQDNLSRGGKGPALVVLPKGRFQMGSESGNENPVHTVKINHSIAMMKTEVTFSDYDIFSNATGRSRAKDQGWGRGKRPVIHVSWDDAVAYAKWLSQQTSKPYRLPSEAEWEYAARSGTSTSFSTGNCIHTDQANYNGNFDFKNCGAKTGKNRNKSISVGSFPANNFGLHDMHGNVWEWVADCQHPNYQGAPSDGKVWPGGDCGYRVWRGGSWAMSPFYSSSASRSSSPADARYFNYLGFRLVQDLNP